jgi:hypothetical protein
MLVMEGIGEGLYLSTYRIPVPPKIRKSVDLC